MAYTQAQLNQMVQQAQAKGIDPARIQNALRNTIARQGQPQVQQPHQRSLIAQLAPLLGSIGGGVLGSIAAPGLGTAAGGAAGGALGEALAERLSGEQYNPGSILREGAFGGIGGAGEALQALRGVGTAAKVARTAEEVGQAARGVGLAEKGIAAVGRGVGNAGENLATKALRASPSQLSGFAAKHGVDIVPVLQGEGLIGKSAEEIRSAIEPVQSQFSRMITEAKVKVDPKNVVKTFEQHMQPLLESTDPQDAKIANRIQENLKNIVGSIEKDPSVSNLDKLRKAYDSKVNYKLAAQDIASYGEKKTIADALRSSVQQAVDSTGVKGPLGENLKQLGSRLNKLYDISAIADSKAHLGRGSLPLGLTKLLSIGGGALGGGIPGAIAGAAAESVLNSPAGMRLASQGLTKAGAALQRGAPAIGKTIGTVAKVGVGQMAGNALFGNGQPQDQQQPDQSAMYQQPQMQDYGQMQGQQPDQSQQQQQLFLAAMLSDLQRTGGKNIAKIQAIAQFAGAGKPKQLTADQAKANGFANRLQQANDIMDQLSAQVNPTLTASYSLERNIPERFRGGVFKQQDQAERNFVNAILRRESGAAISASEFQSAAQQYFPQPGDSPQVLEQKRQNRLLAIQNLQSEASGYANQQSPLISGLNGLLGS